MYRSPLLTGIALIVLIGCTSCGNVSQSIQVQPQPTPTATIPRQETNASCQPVPSLLDDRTSPAAFIRSYYNAIARKEYLRAYLYQYPLDDLARTPTPVAATGPLIPPSFADWRSGYTDTGCTIVTYVGVQTAVDDTTKGYAGIKTGVIIPILLTAFTRNGVVQQFQGIYAVRFDLQRSIQQSGALVLGMSQLQPA